MYWFFFVVSTDLFSNPFLEDLEGLSRMEFKNERIKKLIFENKKIIYLSI